MWLSCAQCGNYVAECSLCGKCNLFNGMARESLGAQEIRECYSPISDNGSQSDVENKPSSANKKKKKKKKKSKSTYNDNDSHVVACSTQVLASLCNIPQEQVHPIMQSLSQCTIKPALNTIDKADSSSVFDMNNKRVLSVVLLVFCTFKARPEPSLLCDLHPEAERSYGDMLLQRLCNCLECPPAESVKEAIDTLGLIDAHISNDEYTSLLGKRLMAGVAVQMGFYVPTLRSICTEALILKQLENTESFEGVAQLCGQIQERCRQVAEEVVSLKLLDSLDIWKHSLSHARKISLLLMKKVLQRKNKKELSHEELEKLCTLDIEILIAM